MRERDFAIQLATLAEAFGEQKLTPVRIEAYHKGLKDVPHALFSATVDRMIQTLGSDSFRWTALPLVADIRKMAEQIRREQLAANPYEACIECEHSKGWIEVRDSEGVMRARRCGCWHRYNQKLETLGLTKTPILQIEAPSEELAAIETPTVEQLPAPIGERVTTIARAKVLR